MNSIELTILSFASKIGYKLLSFLHKLMVFMYSLKHFFQLFKRRFFVFHTTKLANQLFKLYEK